MSDLTRRRFIELALGSASGFLIAGCAPAPPESPPTAGASPPLMPRATLVRGQIVENENRRDRNIRYFKPFVPPTPEDWRMTIGGLVNAPLTMDFADMQQLPYLEQVSRMKCVECWSFRAGWGGFALASLLEHVQPSPAAEYLRLKCADGYWEILSVGDLLRERVLFAYRMDGEFLADEYGSPLRLMVPWKYGYKGAKCITGLEFVAEPGPGYWPTVGPYSISGDIERGYDVPQETGTRVEITEPGKELAY